MEREVLEARKQNKIIIPCRYRGISWTDLKWDLNKLQGFEFDNKNSLIKQLDEIIFTDSSSVIPTLEEKASLEYTTSTKKWRNWLPAFILTRKSQAPTSTAKPPKSTRTGAKPPTSTAPRAEPPTDTINPKDISFTKNKKSNSKKQARSKSGSTTISGVKGDII